MARTPLTVVELDRTHPGGSKAISYVAADIALGNSFILTGREVLLIKSTDAGIQSVVIESSPDSFGREGDLTLSIGIGAYHAIAFMDRSGWVQSGGICHVDATVATIAFAVIRLPAA